MCHVQKAVSIGIEGGAIVCEGGGQRGRGVLRSAPAMHSTLTS